MLSLVGHADQMLFYTRVPQSSTLAKVPLAHEWIHVTIEAGGLLQTITAEI